ncbi:nuclear transport factor 2 family protein [Kutzneria albida]|uniref:nuclear transport factor 2 family protein n=1 Tax=Kutzneria albida TaxID=43357 RepID=UPI00046C9979|nr:nuclear transport factor 2 family protein [Kutzneria albida]
MSIVTSTTTSTPVSAEVYEQVRCFYSRQMQLIDSGRVQDWVETFVEDAVIANNANPEPARGREIITRVAHRIVNEARENGVLHRHWLGMLTVDRLGPDSLATRFYAFVVETAKGGQPEFYRSTIGRDVLVRHGSGWQVRERYVTHDGS